MDKLGRLTAEERGNLVAYLDGELNDAESKVIERKLSGNQVAQHDVEMLARTWDLLEFLPGAHVSEEFTRKTLSLTQQKTAPAPLAEQPWFQIARRGMMLTAWSTAVTAAAAVGFCATNLWVPNDAALLIQDLPVIEHLDQYRDADSVEFLRDLIRTGTFHEDSSG